VSTANATTPPPTPLYAAEGPIVVDACEAILKGVLESQVEVGAIAAPPSPRLAGFARALLAEANQKLLSRHQTEVLIGGDGARAVALALATVRSGRSGVAVVPSGDLIFAVEALREARSQFRDPEHGLAVILEDDPAGEPMLCPRRIAIGAGLAVVEPPDLSSLRDAIEHALRLSRAGVAPVAIVVHASLLSSIETIFARPNRIVSNVDELILQRRLRAGSRTADAGDLLRVARRLEMNSIASLPSPGEREVVGFIAIGVCERALAHVLEELTLAGRVPVLRLGLVSPVDEAPLQRLLDRVQQVVVLEPRPGVAAAGVLATVESLRRRGVRVPAISCRELPPDREGIAPVLEPNDGCSPSILVRKTIHLLHAVRPSLAVATRLEGSDAALQSIAVPARDDMLGAGAALRSVQQLLVELDQELRSRPEPVDGEPSAPRSLAIDALPPRSDSTGIVAIEVFSRRRFLREGSEAIRQSARDVQQRLLVVLDVGAGGGSDVDLLRVADAAIPASAGSRVRAARVDVNDRVAVRERILEAVHSGSTRVLVLSDGPPARLDADAIDRSFAERDRLGYQPQQRLVWNAEIACELRPPTLGGLLDEAEEQGSTPIQGSFTRENTGSRLDGAQFRAVTLSEQVEVVRTKPPITAFSRAPVGLAPPRAIHGEQGSFRVHLAGYRTAMPGVVARILEDAGRAMGYRVEVRASDEPCGRGRRAWAQVLFVRMRGEEPRAPRMGAIPYGEADLVIGIDGVETLRALGPDAELRVASSSRTTIVANRGPLEDQFRDADLEACGKLELAAAECAQLAQSAIDDFATVCRTNLLSERLLDVALLGLAFQRGLVPVSLDAIEAAVRRAELQGTGRCAEAFHFGRRLAGEGIVRRSAEEGESRERLVRRLALELVRERFGGRRRAQRFALSAAGILAAFSRFGESDEVDRAARAAVTALHRSIVWGGTRMMRQYEALLAGLLRADPSGDLALTAAEPLADALLVRDILYVLSMSTSLEQRRRIRERLGVRASHGDKLERRFLSRFELLAGSQRFRLDFRSSDWPAEIVRLIRPLVPWSLRGESRAQEIRAYAISLAERAARGFEADPIHWSTCVRRFAMLAGDNGLRSITAAELRASVEGL
jgi:indolepyruvate ferredoxin oxidoreductase